MVLLYRAMNMTIEHPKVLIISRAIERKGIVTKNYMATIILNLKNLFLSNKSTKSTSLFRKFSIMIPRNQNLAPVKFRAHLNRIYIFPAKISEYIHSIILTNFLIPSLYHIILHHFHICKGALVKPYNIFVSKMSICNIENCHIISFFLFSYINIITKKILFCNFQKTTCHMTSGPTLKMTIARHELPLLLLKFEE